MVKSKKGTDKTDELAPQVMTIPTLEVGKCKLRLVGEGPLMVNNKLAVAWAVAERYQRKGGTKKPPMPVRTPEEEFEGAFYVLPSSPEQPPHPNGLYGVPASGIKKCMQKAIRLAGFTSNTDIGVIGRSFNVRADEGGLCLVRHNGFVKDARPVNIGSGQKTVPNIRHRPLFDEWEIHVLINFNSALLGPEQLANLANHAGHYVGLCEMRAEKQQGECGGFGIDEFKGVPTWATDKRWNVAAEFGFKVLSNGKPARKRRK